MELREKTPSFQLSRQASLRSIAYSLANQRDQDG